METIFIQIASYRDPRLSMTVRDAIQKASHPERLRFGVCMQNHPDDVDDLAEWRDDDRVRIDDVDSRKSRGCCWARYRVQQMYQGEDYTLQLDSHHLFVEGWDDLMIDMLARCPSEKPVISCYLPQCPDLDAGNLEFCMELYEMYPHFEHDPIILQYKPSIRHDGGGLKQHMHWSGHFVFARGGYILEVPYDPELYFIGEEISMAVRTYTSGYDIYLPDAPVAWHEYSRILRHKHWGDHSAENRGQDEMEHIWTESDSFSKAKVRALLSGMEISSCGLGTVRTLADYESAAGIVFASSFVHPKARALAEAPIFSDTAWRTIPQYDYTVRLEWPDQMPVMQEFMPNKLAVFCRDQRADIEVGEELPEYAEMIITATSPPELGHVWPYRCHPHPLQWGEKTPVTVKITSEKQVHAARI